MRHVGRRRSERERVGDKSEKERGRDECVKKCCCWCASSALGLERAEFELKNVKGTCMYVRKDIWIRCGWM